MTLKTLALAGATLVSLAAPAIAMAQPYGYGYDHGYSRDRDDWRRPDYRAYGRWDGRYAWRDERRCFTENRGYYNWTGRYVSRPVEVCR
jgi:hypothetical protein